MTQGFINDIVWLACFEKQFEKYYGLKHKSVLLLFPSYAVERACFWNAFNCNLESNVQKAVCCLCIVVGVSIKKCELDTESKLFI